MKKLNFSKDVLPHLVALIVFVTIATIFFNPVIFDNKSLTQGDIIQARGTSNELINYREVTGNEGLWTNAIFSGMPAYFVNVRWSNRLIYFLNDVFSLGLPHPLGLFMASMVSFYILLLCFKVRPYLAIVGAVSFAFCSYNIIGTTAGHNLRIAAIAYMPLVMGGIHLCLTRNKWLGFGLTALALSLQLRPNHLQITYYLALIVGIYGIIQLIHAYRQKTLNEFFKRAGLLIAAAIIAVGTVSGQFYAAYEFGKYSNRGPSELTKQEDAEMNQDGLSKTYAFQYSNGLADPMTLFIPNFLGGSQPLSEDSELVNVMRRNGANPGQIQQYRQIIPAYWGKESPTTYYAGAIMVFLFVVGLFVLERKYIIWLVLVTILGIVLSYGRNMPSINYFFFDYLPGYNKFRSVTFTIIMPLIGIILMAMLAMERLLSEGLEKVGKKKVLMAFYITAGLALIFAVFAGMFGFRSAIDTQLPEVFADAVQSDRKGLLRADAFRSFLFIALFGVAFYLHSLGKLSKTLTMGLLVALPIIDIMLIGSRFISDANYARPVDQRYFQETPADKSIKASTQLGDRVFDLTSSFYDGIRSYHHHVINGYNGVRIRRYQEVIDNQLIPESSTAVQKIQSGNIDFSDLKTLNMLNTRFFVSNPGSPQGFVVNSDAFGPAWFVEKVTHVDDADGEFNSTPQIDPRTEAVINRNEVDLSGQTLSTNGSISLVDYHPGYWKYQSSNTGDGLAVFSEIHYPKGFEVTIDGQKADMLRANYILRALQIPAGEHTIEFKFVPKAYTVGNPLMLVFSILVILIFITSVYLSLRVPKVDS